MRNVAILLAVVTVLALAGTTYAAAVVQWDGGGADDSWCTSDNWDAPLGSGNHALISSTYVSAPTAKVPVGCTVNGAFASIRVGCFGSVGHLTVNGGTLNPAAGSELMIGDETRNGEGGVVEGDSSTYPTFTMLSGTATLPWIEVAFSEDQPEVGHGRLRFEGGALTVDGILNLGDDESEGLPDGFGVVQVIGNATSSSFSVGSYEQSDSSRLEIDLDGDNGVTSIIVSGQADFDGTIKVTNSGSALTKNHYVLMTYGSKIGAFDTKDLTGLPAGWSVEYDQGTGNNELWLVPEPATMALLGIGGISVLIRRRKR